MKTFKNWFFAEDSKDNFLRILSDALGIKENLLWNRPLGDFTDKLSEVLNNSDEFSKLPQEIQNRVNDKIRLGDGNVGDIINMMSVDQTI